MRFFLTRRGDTLHRFGWNLAWRSRHDMHCGLLSEFFDHLLILLISIIFTPHFTPLVRGCGSPKLKILPKFRHMFCMFCLGSRSPTGRCKLVCVCLVHWKALGISAVVYAAKRIIQSSITARHAVRPFVKILWPLFNFVIIIIFIVSDGGAAGSGGQLNPMLEVGSRLCLWPPIIRDSLTGHNVYLVVRDLSTFSYLKRIKVQDFDQKFSQGAGPGPLQREGATPSSTFARPSPCFVTPIFSRFRRHWSSSSSLHLYEIQIVIVTILVVVWLMVISVKFCVCFKLLWPSPCSLIRW